MNYNIYRMTQIIEISNTQKETNVAILNFTFIFDNSDLIIQNGVNNIRLINAVDNGETIDQSRVHIILSKNSNKMRVIGGEKTYIVDINNIKINSVSDIFRKQKYSEFWYTKIINEADIILIELENEIIILDKDLIIIFHHKKYFNEHIVEHTNEKITLDCEGQKYEVEIPR